MNIHFASLVGAGIDTDLLPFWINHYSKCGFDSYTVYLHSVKGGDEVLIETATLFGKHGWTARLAPQERFRNGGLRQKVLNQHLSTLDPRDSLVTADSDEFHDIHPRIYRDMVEEYHCIGGKLVDRYDTTLHDAGIGEPLDLQFPLTEPLDEIFDDRAKRRVYPEVICTPWPKTSRHKILAARCFMNVNFIGSHHLECAGADREIPESIHGFKAAAVKHYSWRSTVFDRMRPKSYYDARHLWCVGKQFSIPDSRLKRLLADDIVEFEKGSCFSDVEEACLHNQ